MSQRYPIIENVLKLNAEGLSNEDIIAKMVEGAPMIADRVEKILQAATELGQEDHGAIYNREMELHGESNAE